LIGLGAEIRDVAAKKKALGRVAFTAISERSQSFNLLADIIANRGPATSSKSSGRKLGDVLTGISTGITPPRAAYADTGLFLIKVGNLTGAGLDWMPRKRNFIEGKQAGARERSKRPLLVQVNDIVLTSSAHNSSYIAKKADIVWSMPEWTGGRASFVGEVMLLRPDPDAIEPFQLLAFLRHPKTVERIQLMVRGQTAHLHTDDLAELELPAEACDPAGPFADVAKVIRQEAEVADRMNELAFRQWNLFQNISLN
jgi:type I restriction enzyme M protein